MTQAVVSELCIYPIKSGAQICLPSAWVDERGLALDRRFVICDSEGQFITARQEPRLLQLVSTLVHDGLVLSAPGQHPYYLRYRDISDTRRQVQIWNDLLAGQHCPDSADQWLSTYLGKAVHLLYNDADSYRVAGRAADRPVLFSDSYPILLTSERSLQTLQQAGPTVPAMRRFRPNLVISGADAWMEDHWRRIRIGDVELEVTKPCERCVLITRDPLTGEKDPRGEPLKTLAKIHRDSRGRVCFGQNLLVRRPGLLTVGARVEVLE